MSSSLNIEPSSLRPTIIRSSDRKWGLGWSDLVRHRELLYFLTWRDIKVRYKQTLLGVIWAILQPLAIALSLTLFLSHIVPVPQGSLPYAVFAYSGMTIWQFFAQSVSEGGNSLLSNERLVSKIYFPRLLVPLSSVMASLLDFGLSLIVLIAFLVYFRIPVGLSILFFPIAVLLAALTACGAGFWLSALNVKYRDVRYTINFLVQFWFLASPVAYPSSVVPQRWRLLYQFNPMNGAVEGFRWALHGTTPFPLEAIALSTLIALVLFATGVYYFRRTEDMFADFI